MYEYFNLFYFKSKKSVSCQRAKNMLKVFYHLYLRRQKTVSCQRGANTRNNSTCLMNFYHLDSKKKVSCQGAEQIQSNKTMLRMLYYLYLKSNKHLLSGGGVNKWVKHIVDDVLPFLFLEKNSYLGVFLNKQKFYSVLSFVLKMSKISCQGSGVFFKR